MSFALRRLVTLTRSTRSFHASPSAPIWENLAKINFNMNLYRKYGLLEDDLLQETDPDVREAIKRLPEDVKMKRHFRAIRASQLAVEHNILPESQWTKFEENEHYLKPYLDEVIAERLEREEWERNH